MFTNGYKHHGVRGDEHRHGKERMGAGRIGVIRRVIKGFTSEALAVNGMDIASSALGIFNTG